MRRGGSGRLERGSLARHASPTFRGEPYRRERQTDVQTYRERMILTEVEAKAWWPKESERGRRVRILIAIICPFNYSLKRKEKKFNTGGSVTHEWYAESVDPDWNRWSPI